MAPDRSLRWMPTVVGVIVFVATLLLALSARNILVFVATVLLFVPALLFASLGLAICSVREKRSGRRISILLAIAAIVITAPIVYIVGVRFRDHIVFAFWSQTHGALISRFNTQDGIVSYWDGWGFAGNENDAYLVADHGDKLSSNLEATTWVRRRGRKCEIVDIQQMRRAFYVMTTYQCALDQ